MAALPWLLDILGNAEFTVYETFSAANEPSVEQGWKSKQQEDLLCFPESSLLLLLQWLCSSQEQCSSLRPRDSVTGAFSGFLILKIYKWWKKILVIILYLSLYWKKKNPRPNQGVQQRRPWRASRAPYLRVTETAFQSVLTIKFDLRFNVLSASGWKSSKHLSHHRASF